MDQDAYKESSKAEKDKKESLTKEWQTQKASIEADHLKAVEDFKTQIAAFANSETESQNSKNQEKKEIAKV